MTNSKDTQYYNNTTSTPCYINEIKTVTPKKGDAFIAVKASLLDGRVDDPTYERIDMIVKGEQAITLLHEIHSQWPTYDQEQEKRSVIFATIRFGSLSVKPYNTNAGEAAAVLSGRLIEITYLSVNKNVVFQKAKPVTQEKAATPAIQSDQPQMQQPVEDAPNVQSMNEEIIPTNHAVA